MPANFKAQPSGGIVFGAEANLLLVADRAGSSSICIETTVKVGMDTFSKV
jgi:hypothetical protein